jgi:curved DNA-binding protein CbpA
MPTERVEDERVKSYRERAQELLTLDHFAALGVSRTATPEEVQKAFFEAAKTWHPDRVPADAKDLRPLFIQVFGRLDLARATLADPARRLRYVEDLAKPTKRASAGDVAVAEATLEFKKAEALLKKNDAAQAERHLRRAIQLAPTNTTYQAWLVWLQAKPASSHEEVDKLRVDLDKLIARDDRCERAFFFRGQLKKRLGNEKQAHSDFVRASELDPSNIDAQREVRIYTMRQERAAEAAKAPVPSEGVGGFFRKLFKR